MFKTTLKTHFPELVAKQDVHPDFHTQPDGGHRLHGAADFIRQLRIRHREKQSQPRPIGVGDAGMAK